MPRWAWGSGASLVQPPTLSAEGGFTTAQRPPAPWFNWQFNALGGWIDYLRSPNVESWVRIAWATSPGSYDSSSPVLLAVDATTTDVTGAAYRMVIAGWETGPTSTLHVSQRGNAWTRRTNLPGGFSKPVALAHLSNAARWVIADDTPALWYAPHDAGAGTSPVGGSSSGWVSCSGTSDDGSGALTAVKAFASNTSQALAVTTAGGLWSADGVTWAAISESTARGGNGLDVVWDGANFVYITSDGEVYASPTASGSFALKTTLAGGAADWRLAVGASGEVLAYVLNSGSVLDLYRSTNSGTSWTALTPVAPTGDDGATRTVIRLSCVRGHDGVWVATSTVAPFLWVSNDATNWTPLRMPVSGAGALQAVAWDGGAWVAAGNGWVIQCPRGADPSAGDYVADASPSTLSDAASLRGRRIETGTPSNGDTLVWNSSTELWEYGAGGGGGGSVASTDITDSSASGRVVLTGTPAEGLDAIHPWIPVSLASATGWSDWSGAGTTAVLDTALHTITCTVPTSAGSVATAALARASLWPGAGAVEARARLSTLSGPTSDDHFASLILTAAAFGDYAILDLSTSGKARFRGLGTTSSWVTIAGIGGGDGWARVMRDGAAARFYVGIGSGGAPPTVWTYLGAASSAAVTQSGLDYLTVTMGSGASRASDAVAVWESISYRVLDLP